MKSLNFPLLIWLVSVFYPCSALADSVKAPTRFDQGYHQFGAEIGFGTGLNLPDGPDRTDIQFAHISANFQWDLTGNIGQSFYQGNLNWYAELNAGLLHNPGFGSLVGFSPLMFQYKFFKPGKKWAPTLLGGAGFALTDWDEDDLASREIGGDFQFLLHAGVGIEYFRPGKGSFSINYRIFHLSNAGIERPNIGLNANLFTLGFTF